MKLMRFVQACSLETGLKVNPSFNEVDADFIFQLRTLSRSLLKQKTWKERLIKFSRTLSTLIPWSQGR